MECDRSERDELLVLDESMFVGEPKRGSSYKATPVTGNLPWVASAGQAEAFKQPG